MVDWRFRSQVARCASRTWEPLGTRAGAGVSCWLCAHCSKRNYYASTFSVHEPLLPADDDRRLYKRTSRSRPHIRVYPQRDMDRLEELLSLEVSATKCSFFQKLSQMNAQHQHFWMQFKLTGQASTNLYSSSKRVLRSFKLARQALILCRFFTLPYVARGLPTPNCELRAFLFTRWAPYYFILLLFSVVHKMLIDSKGRPSDDYRFVLILSGQCNGWPHSHCRCLSHLRSYSIFVWLLWFFCCCYLSFQLLACAKTTDVSFHAMSKVFSPLSIPSCFIFIRWSHISCTSSEINVFFADVVRFTGASSLPGKYQWDSRQRSRRFEDQTQLGGPQP